MQGAGLMHSHQSRVILFVLHIGCDGVHRASPTRLMDAFRLANGKAADIQSKKLRVKSIITKSPAISAEASGMREHNESVTAHACWTSLIRGIVLRLLHR